MLCLFHTVSIVQEDTSPPNGPNNRDKRAGDKVSFLWGADAGVNPGSPGQDSQRSCIWAAHVSAPLSGLLHDIMQED